MKKKPNWKLMSNKDKARYRAKHGTASYSAFGGRPRSKKNHFNESKEETLARLKASRMPKPKLTQKERRKLAGEGVAYWASGVAKAHRIAL